jgi:hypothetical protein
MSAQSQEQQVDHGQNVDTAQHVNQAQQDQTQDVDQDQAQTTDQVNNTAQAGTPNIALFNLLPAMLQIGAQQATAMFRAVTTRRARTSSSASNGSNGSNGPTTPFENEIDEPVIVTPSMYEQESPIIQPQDQHQEEPHPLQKSERCRNIPLLRQVGEAPNTCKKDQEEAVEYLKDSDTLPSRFYDKYDLKVQYESSFESESESGSDSRSEYGAQGAIYFETGRFHGPSRRGQAA